MKQCARKSAVQFLSGISMAAMAVASPAVYGQDDAEATLDTIIVTARKTDENLQETPVAVSVVGAETIQELAIQDLGDISKLTAGLVFDNEFGRNSNRPVIRGQANILGDSGVSYFIDGVRISGTIADFDLNDVEQIEVVKGPQSALYGRNTYSGAINIITRSPSEELSARASLEYSELDRIEASVGISGPITDTLSFGINSRYYRLGDPFTNQFDGESVGEEESVSVSGVLYWQPNEALDVRLRGYYAESDDGQPALFATDPDANNCFFDDGALYGGNGRYFCGVIAPQDINTDYINQIGPDAGTEIDTSQISLSVDYQVSEKVSISSVTGYYSQDINTQTDGDYSPTSFQATNFVPGGFPINILSFAPFSAVYGYPTGVLDFSFASVNELEEFSEELRIEYQDDRLRAMIGGYVFDSEQRNADDRTLPAGAQDVASANFAAELASQEIICGFNPTCVSIVPLGSPIIPVLDGDTTIDIRNYAIFGLIGYDITEDLSITVEGRWQSEEIQRSGVNVTDRDVTFRDFSPRVTLDWQATPNNLLYAVFAQGQKPGGFNSDIADSLGQGVFEEEEVRASFELGSKNVWMDGQLIANFAVYFNEIEGYQLTQNVASMSNTTSATVNAGDAEIYGLEAEFTWRPQAVPGLTAILNYAYTNAEFTEGRDQNEGLLQDVLDDGLVNASLGCEVVDPADPTGCLINAFGSIEGRQIPRTADHTAFFDVSYRADINDDWQWFVGGNLSYESSKFSQVHNLAETGETTLVGARIGVASEKYTIQIWAKNLTDEDASPLVLRYADAQNSFRRNFVGARRLGRHFGATLSANF